MRPSHALVVCCAAAAAAALAAAQDAPRRRVVAFGDLHGDLDAAQRLLRFSGLANCTPAEAPADPTAEGGASGLRCEWTGGDALLVQVGDLVDRGPQGPELYRLFLEELPDAARAAGGDVITLLGNHELMQLQGAFHYVHPDEMNAFGGRKQRKAAFRLPDGEFARLLAALPAAVEVDGTFLVHAGLEPQWADGGSEELSALVRTAVLAEDWGAGVVGGTGPLWTRAPVRGAERGDCAMVDQALLRLNGRPGAAPVRRIVVGHTPQPGGRVGVHCDGRLIAVDVALSAWMRGGAQQLAYLEVDRGVARPVHESDQQLPPEDEDADDGGPPAEG